MTEIISHATLWECATCGHEWEKTAAELGEGAPTEDGPRVVKDANGSVLADGDTVVLIKDLKLRGGAGTLKGAHSKDEQLAFQDLAEAATLLSTVVRNFCQ